MQQYAIMYNKAHSRKINQIMKLVTRLAQSRTLLRTTYRNMSSEATHITKRRCPLYKQKECVDEIASVEKDTQVAIVSADDVVSEVKISDQHGFIPSHMLGRISATALHLDMTSSSFDVKPIGTFESVFPEKNGTPRQGSVVPHGRGKLKLNIPQAHHAIDGLNQFSHIWLVFIFHKNSPYSDDQVKIRPPRLNGGVIGMYATRTPHRPNNLGLTCAKIDRVDGDAIYLSGLDLIDGTPIVDIKPYVPYSDSIQNATCPDWIHGDELIPRDNIAFSQRATEELERYALKCKYYSSVYDVREAIIEILMTDPRPIYMKKKQTEKLYGFRLDVLNIRCRNVSLNEIEIVQIELWDDAEN
jgi:tRNA-Thr(GGU) m(6)t(6)A37 methyltransferase TsaA